ncbi:serine recombinase family domain-containing protein [Sulfurospirillum multivorans]|nr:serine recombinase family domain-containing protein [Sulfurospirillum multivorans]
MEELMTKLDLAKAIGVHRTTITHWVKSDKIHPEPKQQGKPQLFSYRKVMMELGREPKEFYTLIYLSDVTCNEFTPEEELRLLKNFCVGNGWRFKIIIDSILSANSNELFKALLSGCVERMIISSMSSIGFVEFKYLKSLCDEKLIPIIPLQQITNETLDFCKHAILVVKKLAGTNEEILEDIRNEFCK